jgi:hypothetical protein
MILPSFDGLTPRSDSRIAFSTSRIEPLSNGVTTSIRGSGTEMVASWLSGVRVP